MRHPLPWAPGCYHLRDLMRPAVFLDRDGTMIHDVGYLSRIEDVQWFPWTIDAVRLLNRAGFLVCVVSNQGGIGLGLCPEAKVYQIHAAMEADLRAAEASVDGWYFCPHHPRAVLPALRVDCLCRKPRPGLVRAAQQAHAIDLAASFVIGDKAIDMGLAGAVGAVGILVRTGYGAGELARLDGRIPGAAHVCANLMEATSWILSHPVRQSSVSEPLSLPGPRSAV
jgi:D-glycero-D-manno-heptose 1,7-bisphosphate phosphatase